MSKGQFSVFQVPHGGRSDWTSEAWEISSSSTGFEEDVNFRKGHFMAWMSESSDISLCSSGFEEEVASRMGQPMVSMTSWDISSWSSGFVEEFTCRKGQLPLDGLGCSYSVWSSEASQISSAHTGFAEELAVRNLN
ncbi:unnamed protein product [Polarella glacialis]|uniref:Uncharacterized protein n=1 Tax=Polarella glacialis TaxID=89957 RepID=A0A813HC89_POLGL|nr:unnamed protein product [Polarella glacialis]CAE8673677.1 unnamed protein product [Polarella glacialis]